MSDLATILDNCEEFKWYYPTKLIGKQCRLEEFSAKYGDNSELEFSFTFADPQTFLTLFNWIMREFNLSHRTVSPSLYRITQGFRNIRRIETGSETYYERKQLIRGAESMFQINDAPSMLVRLKLSREYRLAAVARKFLSNGYSATKSRFSIPFDNWRLDVSFVHDDLQILPPFNTASIAEIVSELPAKTEFSIEIEKI